MDDKILIRCLCRDFVTRQDSAPLNAGNVDLAALQFMRGAASAFANVGFIREAELVRKFADEHVAMRGYQAVRLRLRGYM